MKSKNSKIYFIAFITCLGGFLFGFDTGIISGVLTHPKFIQKFGTLNEESGNIVMTSARQGDIASALQAGFFIGGFFQPYLNDGFGRKTTLITMSSIFIIAVVIQTFAINIWMLFVGRALGGACVGVISISVTLYNGETAPDAIRGKIVGSQQILVATGIATSYWVNYAVAVPLNMLDTEMGFIFPLALQAVPAVFMIIGMFFVPQSPRWLASKGRWEEAKNSLAIIRKTTPHSTEVALEIDNLKNYFSTRTTSTWREVFQYENLKRFSVGIPFIAFQQFAGQNMVNYFAPTMFKSLGFTGTGAALYATGFVGFVKIFATIPAVFYVDRFGRRPLFLIGTFGMAASFYFMGSYFEVHDPSKPSDNLTYGAIACVYLFMAFYSISWAPLHYILLGEIYPQLIRAKSDMITGFFDAGGQLASIKLAPIILDLPRGMPFFIYAVLLSLFLVWGFVFLPETRNYRLEDIYMLFEDWKRWRVVQPPIYHTDQGILEDISSKGLTSSSRAESGDSQQTFSQK